MRVYHWPGAMNWGDRLSAPLIRRFAGIDIDVTHNPYEADVLCVGSVMAHVSGSFPGTVLGTGIMYAEDRVPYGANVRLVRGLITRAAMGAHSNASVPLGDPGLIADELVGPVTKTHKLGLLPHWSDLQLNNRHEFYKYDPLFIYPHWEPLRVIEAIGSCEKLVTSSLHGMILADAFGIPRRFEMAQRLHNEGGILKHLDYSSSIGTEFEIGKTIEAPRFRVDDVRQNIFDVFEEFGADHG